MERFVRLIMLFRFDSQGWRARAGIFLSLLLTFSLLLTPQRASAQNPCGQTYVVLPGDTLIEIAALCSTRVDHLLAANLQIQNPRQLAVGQVLVLPDPFPSPHTVSLSHASGPPGTVVQVRVRQFPAGETVEIGLGRSAAEVEILKTLTAGPSGNILTTVQIPAQTQTGEEWVVVASAGSRGFEESAISPPFRVSSEVRESPTFYHVRPDDDLRGIAYWFKTTPIELGRVNPGLDPGRGVYSGQRLQIPAPEGTRKPRAAISPRLGLSGTQIQVIVTGFPPNQDVTLEIARRYEPFALAATDVTDHNGMLAAYLTIPAESRSGDVWEVRVAAAQTETLLEAVSEVFFVTTSELGQPLESYP